MRVSNGMGGDEEQGKKGKHKGKHDKPKPWDEDPNIDHWKIEKFDPSWNEGGMLEVSSFSTLFPAYLGSNFNDYMILNQSAQNPQYALLSLLFMGHLLLSQARDFSINLCNRSYELFSC